MRILITNDDGIYAPGMLSLKQELARLGEVYVVAPDRPRSASGHSITLHKPLRMNAVKLPDGSQGWATTGTPSDCITLAVYHIIGAKPDLVISGINTGPNLGYDLTYSGTVAGAMEGSVMGIPSFAISLTTFELSSSFEFAARFSRHLAENILKFGLPPFTLLNVNVPNVPEHMIQGVEITRVGRRTYPGRAEKRTDPMGKDYYWLGGDLPQDEMEEGTDVKAVADDKVSITPIHMDLTNYSVMEQLQNWDIIKGPIAYEASGEEESTG
jgi:5'-nucleotidase